MKCRRKLRDLSEPTVSNTQTIKDKFNILIFPLICAGFLYKMLAIEDRPFHVESTVVFPGREKLDVE